jgi:hypothetical protein
MAVAVMVCISGSETWRVTTGTPYSQMKSFLSSELETNLFYSMKVRVLTAPKCCVYYMVFWPVRRSNWKIFFWLVPQKKTLG